MKATTAARGARTGDALLFALAFAVTLHPSAHAAGCHFAPQGEGRVSEIIDGRTFRFDDGREVILAGIEIVKADGDAAGNAALANLVTNRDVTLQGENDMPDRYGRQPAFAFSSESDQPVQLTLLTQGAALVSATVANADCANSLLAAEREARLERRGIWVNATVIKNAESAGDILAAVGQFALVEGRVLSVRQAGATTYVNFGRRWTQDFAVTISRRMMTAFEAAGISPKSLERRRIRVRGFVERHGGPRIEALRLGQIEVVGDN